MLPLSIGLVTGAYLFRRVAIKRFLLPVFMGAAIVSSAGYVWEKIHRSNGREDSLAMSSWIRTHLPVDSRIFQVNGCGTTGYLSQRKIINGDGLINGWEYQEYLSKEA